MLIIAQFVFNALAATAKANFNTDSSLLSNAHLFLSSMLMQESIDLQECSQYSQAVFAFFQFLASHKAITEILTATNYAQVEQQNNSPVCFVPLGFSNLAANSVGIFLALLMPMF